MNAIDDDGIEHSKCDGLWPHRPLTWGALLASLIFILVFSRRTVVLFVLALLMAFVLRECGQ